MRAIGKALVVYLAMTSFISMPLGVVIFVACVAGRIADVDYSDSLRFGFICLAIGAAPAVALILRLRLLRGKWLP